MTLEMTNTHGPLDEDWELFPIVDHTDKKSIAKTWDNIKKETMNAAKWRGFPTNAIVIGENNCGDKIIFLPPIAFLVKIPERLLLKPYQRQQSYS